MSRKYKFRNPEAVYFVSFATVNWIDVFTRREYKDIVVDSLNYCIREKGLIVYAWVIMSNHVHLVIEGREVALENVLRDMKKHTANEILDAIKKNQQESRREWMLWMFERAGKKNPNNSKYQFWQQHNQPIELTRHAYGIDAAIDYVHENPVKAGFVSQAESYPYSSAVDFAGGKGLVNIVPCW
ncbi:MAG: transposase [Bacteroidota bacterium]|nr:transposase [Bacteroidota bacterium]